MQTFTDSQLIVNSKGILQLLELAEMEREWLDKAEKLGINIDHGPDYPDILNIVFTLLGFPEDRSLEDPEHGFCRDWLSTGPGEPFDLPPPREYLDWLFEQKKLMQGDN